MDEEVWFSLAQSLGDKPAVAVISVVFVAEESDTAIVEQLGHVLESLVSSRLFEDGLEAIKGILMPSSIAFPVVFRVPELSMMHVLDTGGLKRTREGALREPWLAGDGCHTHVHQHPNLAGLQLPDEIIDIAALVSDADKFREVPLHTNSPLKIEVSLGPAPRMRAIGLRRNLCLTCLRCCEACITRGVRSGPRPAGSSSSPSFQGAGWGALISSRAE